MTFFEVYVPLFGYLSLQMLEFDAVNFRQLQSPSLPGMSKYSTPR